MVRGDQPSAVGRIILGCNALSTLPTRRAAFRLLDTAVACGIRHFDTARSYGQGFSERVLGEFLAGQADALQVTTKLGAAKDSLGLLPTRVALPMNALRRRRAASGAVSPMPAVVGPEPTRPIGRAEVEQSIERSLRCLRRDWIDVFLLHESLPGQLDDAARELVAALRADGTIRKFGIGTVRGKIEAYYVEDPLCEVLQYDRPPDASQSLLERFPRAMHIYHSVFRQPNLPDRAAVVRDALASNESGKIIFGTTRSDHIRHNLSLLSS